MNDENFEKPGDETPDTTPADGAGAPEGDRIPTDRRPLGFWLRAVDGLITDEFATVFQGEGVTRRDWMLLNALAGDVDSSALAERLARRPKRLRSLEKRGWAEEQGDGTWVLTAEGRAAKERLGDLVDGVRARVAGAVSPEDFATTVASLEAIARELGWDESEPQRGFGRFFGPGFGDRAGDEPGFGRGFGPRPGFGPGFRPGPPWAYGPRPGFGPGFDPRRAWAEGWGEEDGCRGHSHHGHHAHGHHGHAGHGFGHHGHAEHHGHAGEHGPHRHDRSGRGKRHDGRGSEAAYERGFDAGYARGAAERS